MESSADDAPGEPGEQAAQEADAAAEPAAELAEDSEAKTVAAGAPVSGEAAAAGATDEAGAGSAVAADGDVGEAESEKPVRSGKTLEQMMSLKPGDDERTEVSKKISWILRHGAKKVGVEMDAEGWVNIAHLLATEVLVGTTEQKLIEMINASNAQKSRYELKDGDGGMAIRAVGKHTIGGMAANVARDRRKSDRPQEGGEEGIGEGAGDHRGDSAVASEQGWRPERPPRGTREDHDRDAYRDRDYRDRDYRDRDYRDRDYHDRDYRNRDGEPSFEQQMREGFRPVYQGGRAVAMVRDRETVLPGKRMEGKGKGKDDGEGGKGKGKWEGKGEGKGKGSDDYGDGRSKGKGKGTDGWNRKGADDTMVSKPRWMAQQGQDAIVRKGEAMESDEVGRITPGQVVVQTGPEKISPHGIIRMPIERYCDGDGIIRGWVTRTAEAANGPVFFKPCGKDGGGKGRDMTGRGSGGKGWPSKGKGGGLGYGYTDSGKGKGRPYDNGY